MNYRFGVFDFDAESGELRKNGRPLPLERQPARVLAVLLTRPGELVSRDELRDRIWGAETHVDFDRGVAYCLSHIRGALGDRNDNPRFVQTLPKRGYRFIAPVTVVDRPAAAKQAVPSPTVGTEPASLHEMNARRRFPAARAAVLLLLLLMLPVTAWFFAGRRAEPVLVAVSVFDNETGVAGYDRPVVGLSDLVVANLADIAPGRLAVIGNADVLRRPRNIRNLQAVADGTRADYVLLGQLQTGEQGMRFVTHVIRLRDMAHLKANRLLVTGTGLSGLERAVVDEFERAVREHILKGNGK